MVAIKAGIQGLRTLEIIGTIALIDSDHIDDALVKKILEKHKNIRTIYRISGETYGEFRIRPLELVYGPDESLTKHKENQCTFLVDVKRTYFNPRLSGERSFVVDFIKKNRLKYVLDAFAGVGPFSIQIAKFSMPKLVVAIDKNPMAYELLRKNVELNKVQDRVVCLCMDSKYVNRYFRQMFDIAIMNFPISPEEFLDSIVPVTKKYVILYKIIERHKIEKFIKKIERKQPLDHILYKSIKSISPSKDMFRIIFKRRR